MAGGTTVGDFGVGVTTAFGVGLGVRATAGFFVTGVFVTVLVVGFFAAVVFDGEVVVVVVVVVDAETVHSGGAVMVSSTRVTAPFFANSRPVTEAVEAIEIEVRAKMVPLNVPPANVAELPTCQKTQPACAPFSSATVLVVEVVRPEPTWKMYTPFPFRVTVPVRSIVEVALYTPGPRVSPVMSA